MIFKILAKTKTSFSTMKNIGLFILLCILFIFEIYSQELVSEHPIELEFGYTPQVVINREKSECSMFFMSG
jgi:hypothetical protein